MKYLIPILCVLSLPAFATVGHIEAYVQDINDPTYTPEIENTFIIIDTEGQQ